MRRRAIRVLAGPAVLAASLTGCAGTPSPAAAPGMLAWTACRSTEGPPGLQCSILRVPLDSLASTGPTIALALDRVPARGPRIGSLIVNPGGPGVSAVDALPGIAASLSSSLRDHFDLIGYDPPGVGHSTPIVCLDNTALGAYLHTDPSPPGSRGFAEAVATAGAFASACQVRSGALLGHVSTIDAARDLDRVRAAVGDPSLDYLGFSYGTLLGATYAGLYPTRVRAMVLDGAIDPSLDPLATVKAQAAAVEAQFLMFASACARAACAWRPGADPTAAFLRLLTRVRATPLEAGGAGRRAGPAELLFGTAEALYSPSEWPALGQALADAQRGDGQKIVAMFDAYVRRASDGSYRHTIEAERAVDCVDTTPPSLPMIEAVASSITAVAPIFGPLEVDGEAACAQWPVPATGGPHTITAAGSVPILVVGSSGDPITPYPWAVHLAAQLGNAVLLTRIGDGHTGYDASICVRQAVDSYMIGQRVPRGGTRCPSS